MLRIIAAIAASLLAGSALAAEAPPSATEAAPSAAEAAPSAVATLSSQEGTVLVNQGEEFITAAEAQPLQAGDHVMVMEGGLAEISFTDGCVLALESGSLLQVPAESTCAGTIASVARIGPSYAQAVGAPVERDRDNRRAGWVFGAWSLGLAWWLAEGDYKITDLPTPPPVSP